MTEQEDPRSPRSGVKGNTFTTIAVLLLAALSVLFTVTLLGSFSGKSWF